MTAIYFSILIFSRTSETKSSNLYFIVFKVLTYIVIVVVVIVIVINPSSINCPTNKSHSFPKITRKNVNFNANIHEEKTFNHYQADNLPTNYQHVMNHNISHAVRQPSGNWQQVYVTVKAPNTLMITFEYIK